MNHESDYGEEQALDLFEQVETISVQEAIFILMQFSKKSKSLSNIALQTEDETERSRLQDSAKLMLVVCAKVIIKILQQSQPGRETSEVIKQLSDAITRGFLDPHEFSKILATIHLRVDLIDRPGRQALHGLKNLLVRNNILDLRAFHAYLDHGVEIGLRTLASSDDIHLNIFRHLLVRPHERAMLKAKHAEQVVDTTTKLKAAAAKFVAERAEQPVSYRALVPPHLQMWEVDYQTYAAAMMCSVYGVNSYEETPIIKLNDPENTVLRRYFHVEPIGETVPVSLLAEYKALQALVACTAERSQQSSFFYKDLVRKSAGLAKAMADRICEIIRAEAMELEAIRDDHSRAGCDDIPERWRKDQIGICDTPDDVFLAEMGPVLGQRFIALKQRLLKEQAENGTLHTYHSMSEEELYALFALKRNQLFHFEQPVHDFHFRLAHAGHKLRQLIGDPEKNLGAISIEIETILGLAHTTDNYFAHDLFKDKKFQETIQILNLLDIFEKGTVSDYSGILSDEFTGWLNTVTNSSMLRPKQNQLSSVLEKSSLVDCKRKGINVLSLLRDGELNEHDLAQIIDKAKPPILQEIYLSKHCHLSEDNIDAAIRRGHYIFDLLLARGADFTERNISTLIQYFLRPLQQNGGPLPKLYAYYPKEAESQVRLIAYKEVASRVLESLAGRFTEQHLQELHAINTHFGDDHFILQLGKTIEAHIFLKNNEDDKPGGVRLILESIQRRGVSLAKSLSHLLQPQPGSGLEPDSSSLTRQSLQMITDARSAGTDAMTLYKASRGDQSSPPTLGRHMPRAQSHVLNRFTAGSPGVYLESQHTREDIIYVLMAHHSHLIQDRKGNLLLPDLKLKDTSLFRVDPAGNIADFATLACQIKSGGNSEMAAAFEQLVTDWREAFDVVFRRYNPLPISIAGLFAGHPLDILGASARYSFDPHSERSEADKYRFLGCFGSDVADVFEEILLKPEYVGLRDNFLTTPDFSTSTIGERKRRAKMLRSRDMK